MLVRRVTPRGSPAERLDSIFDGGSRRVGVKRWRDPLLHVFTYAGMASFASATILTVDGAAMA